MLCSPISHNVFVLLCVSSDRLPALRIGETSCALNLVISFSSFLRVPLPCNLFPSCSLLDDLTSVFLSLRLDFVRETLEALAPPDPTLAENPPTDDS